MTLSKTMTHQSNSRFLFNPIPQAASAAAILVGYLVLLGWMFDITTLKSVLPGLVSMKANTALAFILAGVSLWLLQSEPVDLLRRRIAQVCTLAVLLIGSLTFIEYLAGLDLGIDQLLFREQSGAIGISSPGRMALNTAINFLFVGVALLLLDVKTRHGRWPAQFFIVATALVALLALTGHAYGVTPLYSIAVYTQMALHTAVTFIVLCTGLLMARPDRGLMDIITSDLASGVLSRRLLPAVIGVPIVIGWLRLLGQRAGLYDTEFGISLSVLSSVVLIGVFVWMSVKVLHRKEIERKRAQEELSKQTRILKSVLDSIGEGVVVADSNGKFSIWNPTAEQIVNLGPMDVPKEEWSERYGVYLPDQVTPYPADQLPLARAIRGESVDNDEQFLRHSKVPEGVWLSVTGRPLLDESGMLRGGVVVFNDITERKRTEEEIEKLNEDLKRRALELEAVNKELEAFSYSISHDLRAPLRGIDGFSQALLEDYNDKLDVQGKDHLQRIRAATQRMAQLIDDLLNLSRMTRTELHRETVDLSVIAQSIAAELQKSQPERQVVLAIPEGIAAEGDARLLKVVLENLLGNAWKFTAKHSSARIEFGASQYNGKEAYFVRDNGAGFDMAYVNKLFGAFQRLHAMSEFPGTGIGLATIQRIVHRHGGRVWAEGAVEKGATFYFTL